MEFHKNIKILLSDDLHVSGLTLLGHNITTKALFPMGIHIHKDCLEFVIVIKGNESYYVDEQQFNLAGGDVFVTFANQPHSNGNIVQGVSEFIWFQLNPYIYEDFLGLSSANGNLIRNALINIDNHILHADASCISLLKKSFETFNMIPPSNNTETYIQEKRLYAQNLFTNFLTQLLFMQKQSVKNDTQIQNAIHYIDTNIFNPIPIDELCTICNMSLSGFKHKFSQNIGETPRDYINHRKILKAKELLKNKKSITETAMLLSFNSSDYFSVVFKKYTTFSPSEYRAKHLNK